MSIKNAVIVLGYNNTRINDVRKIREKSRHYLDAITILCKKDPDSDDKAAVDHVINVGLEATDVNINKVLDDLKKISVNVVALLPFSDPGTQLAGELSNKFPYLRGPDAGKIQAALNKHTFREYENQSKHIPDGYKKIKSTKIVSFEQLKAIHIELNGKLFLKPAKEGNSRGCINLMAENNLETVWTQIDKYLSAGIVAEELIVGGTEYSWDHVNGYSWITEKRTTSNQYSSEFQHIVPAPLNQHAVKSISESGEFMAELSGYNNGACHNEIFYFPDSGVVSGVEPNLRPAGGRIWDLACLAFDNFDPWGEWVLWASGKTNIGKKTLAQKYFAGIRKIPAPITGILKKLPLNQITDFLIPDVDFIDLVWTKKIGDAVSNIAKDNSDYIGYIIARAKNYDALNEALKTASINLQTTISIDQQS